MKLIIETTGNGFIVTTKYKYNSHKTVFEHVDEFNEFHEIHTLRRVFNHVQHELGLNGSECDQEVLRPLIIKGTDYDGKLTKRVKETKEQLKHLFKIDC